MVTEPKTKLTYADYAQTPEDERWELIDGELIMAAAPNMEHQATQSEFGWHLQSFVREKDLGWVFFSPTDVALSDTDIVQPDLLFISREREHIIARANIQGAPDIVIEILSPSSEQRDRRDKLDLYARYGVPEYWLIDPRDRTVLVFALRNGGFEEAGAYCEGDTLTSPTLIEFSLELSEAFVLR